MKPVDHRGGAGCLNDLGDQARGGVRDLREHAACSKRTLIAVVAVNGPTRNTEAIGDPLSDGRSQEGVRSAAHGGDHGGDGFLREFVRNGNAAQIERRESASYEQ